MLKEKKQQKVREKLFIVLKFILSISMLTYLMFKIDWEKSLDTIKNANFFWLSIAVFLSILDMMLLTLKWNILLQIKGQLIKFWRLFSINMIGGFWGLFLPSSLSTDVVRGFYLVKTSIDKAVTVTSIFIDRLLALFALFVFVGTAIIFSGDMLEDFHLGIYVIFFFVFAIVGLVIFNSNKFSNLLRSINNKFEGNKILDKIIKLRNAFIEYKSFPTTLSVSFLLSLVVQLERVVWYVVIAWAYGVNIPIIYYFIFCPFIIVVLMLPVSIGGLGVREGAFVALFTLVGMPLDSAIIISFTSSLLANLFTISGGIFYLLYKNESNKLNSDSNIKLKFIE